MRNHFGDLNSYLKFVELVWLWPLATLAVILELCLEPGRALFSTLMIRHHKGFRQHLHARLQNSEVRDAWKYLTGVICDAFRKKRLMVGRVDRKWVETKELVWLGVSGSVEVSNIAVDGLTFSVSNRIYESVSLGSHLSVWHWPESKLVSRVEKVTF